MEDSGIWDEDLCFHTRKWICPLVRKVSDENEELPGVGSLEDIGEGMAADCAMSLSGGVRGKEPYFEKPWLIFPQGPFRQGHLLQKL